MICFFGKRTGFVASPMVTRKAPGSKALLLLAVEAEAIADIHYLLPSIIIQRAITHISFVRPRVALTWWTRQTAGEMSAVKPGRRRRYLQLGVPKILRNNEQF